jgi:hypothetical protein
VTSEFDRKRLEVHVGQASPQHVGVMYSTALDEEVSSIVLFSSFEASAETIVGVVRERGTRENYWFRRRMESSKHIHVPCTR